MSTQSLLQAIRDQFRLDWYGIHGAPHWARVWLFGEQLSANTGADLEVVRLFAVLHDAARAADGEDPDHGRRGAELAQTWRGVLFELDDARMRLLVEACAAHSLGRVSDDPTIQTCWDADRLDLPRVGAETSESLISPSAAAIRTRCADHARTNSIPEIVFNEWQTTPPSRQAAIRRMHEQAVATFADGTKAYARELRAMLARAERALAGARTGDIDNARDLRAFYLDGVLGALAELHEAIAIERRIEIVAELRELDLGYSDDPRINEPTLALRVCGADMRSLIDSRFIWPTSGEVTADTYDGLPEDNERGLYAFKWAIGKTEPPLSALRARDQEHLAGMAPPERWLVLRVDDALKLAEGGRFPGDHGRWIKFGRARVLYVGRGEGNTASFDDAVRWIRENGAAAIGAL